MIEHIRILLERLQLWYYQHWIACATTAFIVITIGLFLHDFSNKPISQKQWQEVQVWLKETPRLHDHYAQLFVDKRLTGKEYLALAQLHQNFQETSPD